MMDGRERISNLVRVTANNDDRLVDSGADVADGTAHL